jgi:hypothetical protein
VSENTLRNALFTASLRKSTVTLKNGVKVVIKQVTAKVGDEIMANLRDEKMSSGEKNARTIQLRCENPDGSPIFDERDIKTFANNVAADAPVLVELVSLIGEFDAETARLYEQAEGN